MILRVLSAAEPSLSSLTELEATLQGPDLGEEGGEVAMEQTDDK